MRRLPFRLLMLATLALACDRDPVAEPAARTPVLTTVSPSSVVIGDAPVTVVLSGEHFTENTRVIWNGVERSAHFIHAQRIEVPLDTTDMGHAHTVTVRVGNDGVFSSDRQFRVEGLSLRLLGPDAITLVSGDTLKLGARILREDGTELKLGVVWRSSDPRVVWVDENGKIEAIRIGSARIEAVVRGYTARMSVTVTAPAPPALHRCEGAGTVHASDITSSETWTRAGNPHWITRTIHVGNDPPNSTPVVWTLEPGVEVCTTDEWGGAMVWLRGRTILRFTGTASLPIELGVAVIDRGLDPTFDSDTSRIAHTNQVWGFSLTSKHVVIENSTIRDNLNLGWRPGVFGLVRNVKAYGDVHLSGDNILENTTVRTAGVFMAAGSRVRLRDVRIEGSSRAGLEMANFAGSLNPAPELLEAEGVRIRASATYPAILSAQGAAVLLKSQAAQDSLMRNALDTLIVYGTARDELTVRKGLPWRVVEDDRNRAAGRVIAAPVVRLEAGAVFDGGIASGRILALGSETDPVTILRGGINVDTPLSELSYFRIYDAPLNALRITSAAEVRNCKIARSGHDAVAIDQPVTVTVRNCDFEDNTGLAINNRAAASVQAFEVWLRNDGTHATTLVNPRATPNWPAW